MSWSESADASTAPSGLYARVITWSAWLLSRITGSVWPSVQTRADVSHPAETSSDPSGFQASAGMRSVWLTRSATFLWVCPSQTRTTRSSPAVATCAPPGANAIGRHRPGVGRDLADELLRPGVPEPDRPVVVPAGQRPPRPG